MTPELLARNGGDFGFFVLWKWIKNGADLGKESEIVFEAIVQKVQTLADNGVRVTLDLPETAIMQMAMLAQAKINGLVLEVTVREKR